MNLSNKILSEITVHMKYAKYLPEHNRRETWEELVTRNKNMHIKKYPGLGNEIEDVYKLVYNKKILPSMRSMQFGGKPIEDYAPDFWLVSPESGGEPVGFITSPWYHPEKKQNIAMGYVPFDGTLNANGFPKGKVGTKFKVHLPEQYSEKAGVPVDAVVVDIPFKESFNANTREVVKG